MVNAACEIGVHVHKDLELFDIEDERRVQLDVDILSTVMVVRKEQ